MNNSWQQTNKQHEVQWQSDRTKGICKVAKILNLIKINKAKICAVSKPRDFRNLLSTLPIQPLKIHMKAQENTVFSDAFFTDVCDSSEIIDTEKV